jgi:AcrR family transcriptional regulator
MTVHTGRVRRATLTQRRSRSTRQAIVRAGLELWAEQGYAGGLADISVQQIASRAGITKTTFYFHFAHKQDILVEVDWLSPEIFYADAQRALDSGDCTELIVIQVLSRLAQRVQQKPRVALRLILRAQSATDPQSGHDSFGLARAFCLILARAQQSGEFPGRVPARVLADMLESLVIEALRNWALADDGDLTHQLVLPVSVLLSGARNLPR